VGYVQESPLWKTSYRLVVDDAADAGADEKPKALLQGWAIVENTTDQDWKDVRMELVSGRPISFTMDLYQPLYVPRPQVMPELYASLMPQLYGQSLADATLEFERAKGGQGAGEGFALRARKPQRLRCRKLWPAKRRQTATSPPSTASRAWRRGRTSASCSGTRSRSR
jgi:hypothetical protein